MDGSAYLEKLIADRLGAGRGQPAQGRSSSLNLAEIRGVALGLVAAGVLGQRAMERIIADLERTLESTGWLTVVRHTMTGADDGASVEPGMMARVGAARPQWQKAIIDPPAPIIRTVISLAGQTLIMAERPVALISVEVWSSIVTLRLAHSDSDGRTLLNRLDSGHRWRGWDDAGTRFRGVGGGGSGSHGLFIEEVRFEPGPADNARTLTLLVEQERRSHELTVALDPPATPT
ncbi:MAG TPA: hypothetical protein VF755_16880 [Catenuloplanes sp.]